MSEADASLHAARPGDGIAWITGASSGIGETLAERLAALGWKVAVTARSAGPLEALRARAADGPGEILVMPGDVTDAARMAEIVAELEAERGPVALAILNAGVYLPVDGTAPDLAAFHASFDVNLKGTANALVPLVAAMKPRRRGQIALVASVAGYSGLPTSAAYGATKAGLINLAEAMKFDLDRLGILLQVVSPGFVDTPATKDNPFPMPHLMPVGEAADALIDGLAGTAFEITFPKRFTRQLKFLRLLPYRLYFPLMARTTGWSRKPRPKD
ncbi:SDR family NAD(P)-dependent oxidoreductase [Stappia sp.]|uniref:SDR family NAD(P)-dependent oxidoreductase n=1 Tax=Stappia sp. TaxID=1870903 RepID=UPI003D0D3FBB